jgi:hypothetical protein
VAPGWADAVHVVDSVDDFVAQPVLSGSAERKFVAPPEYDLRRFIPRHTPPAQPTATVSIRPASASSSLHRLADPTFSRSWGQRCTDAVRTQQRCLKRNFRPEIHRVTSRPRLAGTSLNVSKPQELWVPQDSLSAAWVPQERRIAIVGAQGRKRTAEERGCLINTRRLSIRESGSGSGIRIGGEIRIQGIRD